MKSSFKKTIDLLKKSRNFNVEWYLKEKISLINDFFREENLDSAVVGLSGGVDSAVVYKLLIAASKAKNSPIKLIKGVFLPIYTEGITGQENAEQNVLSLLDSVSVKDLHYIKYEKLDLTRTVECLFDSFKGNLNSWSKGQMACIVRTPALYGQAAQLQEYGFKSLVVGTTNRDEGSYIGFFGKASDAMVDLQPIADIHKSEVYELAKLLNVPDEIIKAVPKGDVWDSKVDEEMIGAPYWFLEMYILLNDFQDEFYLSSLHSGLSKEEEKLFGDYKVNIEINHLKNLHKYKVGSPARFIDVMKRTVEGGWE